MTAGLTLSVLDPSPIFEGRTASDALQETLHLAVTAEASGFKRYWVQEHHNSPSFAGTAPEVLLSALGQRTSHIRLGAGGVMLPNYSPLKVAEQFSMLSALYPERLDLGLGRATGADPRTSAALLGPGAKEFPQMLTLLLSWLADSSGTAELPESHPAQGIKAMPNDADMPDMFMLSSSPQSAAFAGAMGLKLAFADFLSPGGAGAAIKAYRENFAPSAFVTEPYAILAMVCLACDSDEEAEKAASTALAWSLFRAQGQFPPFLKPENARKLLDEVGDTPIRRMVNARAIIGEISQVRQKLKDTKQSASADELMLLTIAHDPEIRERSYELLGSVS